MWIFPAWIYCLAPQRLPVSLYLSYACYSLDVHIMSQH